MTEFFDWGTLMQAAARGQTPLVQFGCGPTTVALHARQPVYLATPYSKIVVNVQGKWSRPLSQLALADAAHEVGRVGGCGG